MFVFALWTTQNTMAKSQGTIGARPDFGENVRGGRKIFRGGATMISPSQQRVKIKKLPNFDNFYIIIVCLHFILSYQACIIVFQNLFC